MGKPLLEARFAEVGDALRWLLWLLACCVAVLEMPAKAQEQEPVAGEKAAQALKEAAQAEAQQYNIHYGPVSFQTGAGVLFGYTDNTFYTETDRKDDFLIIPEIDLAGFMQVSELNTLKLSVALGYEYYFKNTELNASAPQVRPGSELTFNVFVGDFHFQAHEKFSYMDTLFYNTVPNQSGVIYNFTNVGRFTRWDNLAGAVADWDLDKAIFSVGYDHENFQSTTAQFDYLNRASELFTASASFLIGDKVKTGVESQAGLHNYEKETVLNDHWQARVGPFVEAQLPEKINFRAGGGYDTARYNTPAEASDFETYYAYGQISHETRWFTHSLVAGHEHTPGFNANNLEDTYVRYSISSPVVRYVRLEANGAAHFDKEFGGAFSEDYTYYVAGCSIGYQIHKYWRTDLAYEFIQKDSNLPLRGYYRNRVTLGVKFTF